MGLSGGNHHHHNHHSIGSGAASTTSALRSSGRPPQLRSHSPPNGRVTHQVDSDSSGSSVEEGNVVRVGREYQATVPTVQTLLPKPAPADASEHAVLVWSPYNSVPENELEDFISIAKEKYSYNMEQALGMLCWHKFEIETAKTDLPNFTPFPDDWSVEDKVLFEQAFQFHDKHFHKIRQMLPEKSIASLVKYYYGWKKTRSRTSLMDRQARKLKEDQKGDGSDNGSDAGSDDESETASKVDPVSESRVDGKPRCENCCTTATAQFHHTNKGMLCSTCYSYWRRTGTMKNNASKRSATATADSGQLAIGHSRPVLAKQSKRKPPKGIYVSKEDLLHLANGLPGTGEAMLAASDQQIVALKRSVQNNKQIISQAKQRIAEVIGSIDMRPVTDNGSAKRNSRWTKEEDLLAVQALRNFGKDFAVIADIIGNKSEQDVSVWFSNNERRYQLDKVIKQFEEEKQKSSDDKSDTVVIISSSPIALTPSSSQPSSQSKRVRSSAVAAAD